ncbi:MAG TPA: hypothetical protein VFP33_06945 [Gallionella sp.]|nr:hypothetical protein [Gallionella sp.]
MSDGEDWRMCCEAVHWLSKRHDERSAGLGKIEARRGAEARKALDEEMHRIEPAYLLAMGTVEQRRAYLDQVEYYEGPMFREALEARIVALWKERKAATEAAA